MAALCRESQNPFYGPDARRAAHNGASFFLKGQKARFRLILSAIPRGSFFLNFVPKSKPDGPKKCPVLIRVPTTAYGAELPRPLRGDGAGFEGTFAFRCCSYQADEVWRSRPRPLIAALSDP